MLDEVEYGESKKEIMLSIYVPTYNHEKYIVQALDSILMQKTKYTYEVLVGEDASTDNTRAVLMQYEKLHPGVFQIFYREHNLSKEAIGNGMDLRMRGKGKYCIMLEGDDFWTDEYKIEKQIDFLENHPEYVAVAHNCIIVGEDSEPNGEMYPQCMDEEYTFRHFASGILPGQTATVMVRNWFLTPFFDTELLDKKLSPSDQLMCFSFVVSGKVYCIQEIMSAYRHVTDRGSSYSATVKKNFDNEKKLRIAMLDYAQKNNSPEAVKCIELLFALSIRYAVIKRKIKFGEGIMYFKMIKNKSRTIFSVIKRDFRHYVLKKKLVY